MFDPLSRALNEAPEAHDEREHAAVSRYHAVHAPVLGAVLENLRRQLVEAMTTPFFDGPARAETIPVTKHALTETGAIAVFARRSDPLFEAQAVVEVRCDHDADSSDAAGYQVRATGRLRRHDGRGQRERELRLVIREIDGTLRLDAAHLRAELDAAAGALLAALEDRGREPQRDDRGERRRDDAAPDAGP